MNYIAEVAHLINTEPYTYIYYRDYQVTVRGVILEKVLGRGVRGTTVKIKGGTHLDPDDLISRPFEVGFHFNETCKHTIIPNKLVRIEAYPYAATREYRGKIATVVLSHTPI